jgi:hypothetical protein
MGSKRILLWSKLTQPSSHIVPWFLCVCTWQQAAKIHLFRVNPIYCIIILLMTSFVLLSSRLVDDKDVAFYPLICISPFLSQTPQCAHPWHYYFVLSLYIWISLPLWVCVGLGMKLMASTLVMWVFYHFELCT